MVFENGVKNILAAAYNGVRTVITTFQDPCFFINIFKNLNSSNTKLLQIQISNPEILAAIWKLHNTMPLLLEIMVNWSTNFF